MVSKSSSTMVFRQLTALRPPSTSPTLGMDKRRSRRWMLVWWNSVSNTGSTKRLLDSFRSRCTVSVVVGDWFTGSSWTACMQDGDTERAAGWWSIVDSFHIEAERGNWDLYWGLKGSEKPGWDDAHKLIRTIVSPVKSSTFVTWRLELKSWHWVGWARTSTTVSARFDCPTNGQLKVQKSFHYTFTEQRQSQIQPQEPL